MKEAVTYHVSEFVDDRLKEAEVTAIQEVPLTVFVNNQEIVTLLCTGKHPKYLALGFLRSDGLITDVKQVQKVRVDEGTERIKVYVDTSPESFELPRLGRSITSGCGKGTNFEQNMATIAATKVGSTLTISPRQILALASELQKRSILYQRTRGCHNASLCTPEEMLLFREDIGRHNAIDMICGQCFLEAIPTKDKLIVTTGRIASEILLKALRLGVPILVSGSAATRLSIDLARKTNMTLVGLVCEGRMIVYNSAGRVTGL
ncbi:MAG: formate dehydrogenase accessory sulfurtransferase FdhD [Thermodesulfobacteriota bacterium]|nr:formate dehydrogenase accessory sulfurtransferase FdhD [Thermodesulfobacteriota bacterium]